MSTNAASDTDGGEESTSAEIPEAPSIVTRVGIPWVIGLVFALMAYVGATNSDVSPTILGELIFGFIAVALFLVGVVILVRR
jgi:hypothetical protein